MGEDKRKKCHTDEEIANFQEKTRGHVIFWIIFMIAVLISELTGYGWGITTDLLVNLGIGVLLIIRHIRFYN